MALSRPNAVAGGNQVATIGVPFVLDGTASNDPEGFDIDSYEWFLLYVPPGSTAVLTDADTSAPSITPDVIGTYRIFLVVQAGGRESEPDPLKAPLDAFSHVIVVTANNSWTIPARGQRDWDAFLYKIITDIDAEIPFVLPPEVVLEDDNVTRLGSGSEIAGQVPASDGAGNVVWEEKIPSNVMLEGENVDLLGSGSEALGKVAVADGVGGVFWTTLTGGGAFEISTFVHTGSSLIELGDTLTDPSFTASYNGTVALAEIEDDQATGLVDVTGTPTAFTYTASYTFTTFGDSVVWTLTAEDALASSDSDTETSTWVQKVFWGVGAAGGTTEAFIEALANNQLRTNRNKTFTVTASGSEKIYYAYRSAFGDATFTVGGFSGGFFKVSDTISVTNTFGETENYTLYETDNLGLGTTEVVVT